MNDALPDLRNDEQVASFDIALGVVMSRRAGVAATCIWLLLFLMFEPEPWRFAMLFAVLCILAGSMLVQRLLKPSGSKLLLLLLVLSQSLMILATGGIESPMIILVPMTTMMMAFAEGRWRALPLVIGPPALYIAVFAGIRLAGIDMLPAFITLTPERFNKPWALLLTLFISFGMLGGSVVGTFLRLHMNRIHQQALEWKNEAYTASQNRNKDLLRMSGSLAHELKNPLMAIQGLSTLMASQTDEGSRAEKRFQVLVSEVERMGTIVDDFLNLARPIPDIALKSVPVQSLLNDLTLLLEGIAQKRAIQCVATPTDLRLSCDPDKIRQILLNLATNALEASPAGTKVTLSAHQRDQGPIVIRIEDEGVGLDPNVALFVPGITTKSDGSGLGLTIAMLLAEQHGGTIALQNRPDRDGCRADVILPPRTTTQETP